VDLTVDFAYESGREATRLDREIEESIYRLVQECLSNAVKHASATTVRVSVRESAETVEVTVGDDGVGFDGTGVSRGFGLVGMRERVALVNGTMKIETDPGRGTAVLLHLPAVRGSAGHESDIAV
jgi:two-component system sensor histidine kinase DegS